VNELCAPPNQVFLSDELEIRRSSVTELKGAESNKFRITHRIGYVAGMKPLWEVVIIAYSAQAKLKKFCVERRYSNQELNDIHEQLVAEAFARRIRRWLVASLLARTGILRFSDILVTSNDKLWRRDEDFHGLCFEHLEVAQKMKWPPIQALSIVLVWKWLQKVPGFNNDFGVTEVGRALAAFTHLLRRRHPTAVGEVLLWALFGLEALYTRGTSELGAQLSVKTQLLLGEQQEFKKVITRMYSYRSRLTHGDVPIPMHYCEYDGLAEYESFLTEVEDQNYVAANVLLSSLQALVLRNATELKFQWRIVDGPPNSVLIR